MSKLTKPAPAPTTTFPTLYRLNSGKTALQVWTISVTGSTIETEYGKLDGKLQRSSDTITEGKNIGRSNETTPEEQALKEATALWEKKQANGYVQDQSKAKAGKVNTKIIKGGLFPMLANKYAEDGDHIKYPAYLQPKFDGARCVAVIKNGKCTLWSRKRKQFTSAPHVCKALETLYHNVDITLDGELYNHEYRHNFEALMSLIRSSKPKPGHEAIQYHIYDVVDLQLDFSKRTKLIKTGNFKCLHSVETRIVQDEDEAMEGFADFVKQEYEGAMIRNMASFYKLGPSRSNDLQKIKEFDDSEFEIVDVISGRGKFAELGVFLCKAPNGKTFEAPLNAELDVLRGILQNKAQYIGKQLTVQHQGYTKANKVPRFPRGKAIRDYE